MTTPSKQHHYQIAIQALCVFFSLFFPQLWAASAEVPCTDIRKIALQNMRLDVGNAVFNFRNGVGSEFDELEPKTLEWEATLIEAITVDVAPDIPVRFVLIRNSHVSGSGWRFFLVGYRCLQGKMKQVFKREGLSLAIDKIDSQAVVVKLNTEPGTQSTKYFSYAWNDKTSKYELNSSWVKK
jgi:hypothetical protein